MSVVSDRPSLKPDLKKIVGRLDDISTLPQIFNKIIAVTSDPLSGATDLHNILQFDPAITMKILKLANSAFYGLQEKVHNTKRAIVVLGFQTVKNIAVTASVCEIFKSKNKGSLFSREELWKHSVAVAVCAKSIAQRVNLDREEDIFTAGILHDIGIIMEDQYLNTDFIKILSNPSSEGPGFIEREKAVFGFDHAEIGEKVALRWKIPKEIVSAIAFHHKPKFATESQRKMVVIVYLADVICCARKIGFSLSESVNSADVNFAMKTLCFKKEDIAVILEELPEEIEKVKDFFTL